MKRYNLLSDIFSALLIFLLLYTARSKLFDHENFKLTLSLSPSLKNFYQPISWLVPITEILISILLIFPFTKKWGFISAAILLMLFTAYIIYMLNFSSYLPCTCGGVIEKLSWKQHIVFNVLFILIALGGLFINKKLAVKFKRTPP